MRVFPGVVDHDGWANASFHGLRAQGGVAVSAARVDGRTSFVQLTAPPAANAPAGAGSGAAGAVAARVVAVAYSTMPFPWAADSPDVTFEVGYVGAVKVVLVGGLRADAPAVVFPAGTDPELTIRPLPVVEARKNYWGYGPRPPPPPHAVYR